MTSPTPPNRTGLVCPLAISGLLVLPMLLAPANQIVMEYQRTGLENGEYWRLVSGHLIHLSWGHLLMNLLGFWLIQQLFFRNGMPFSVCFFTLTLLTLSISCGLYWFSPSVDWYRGFSGVLHGLLIWGLLRGIEHNRLANGLLLLLVILKLSWEQFSGPIPGSETVTKGRVIVAAHLYGGLAGALLWALENGIQKFRSEDVE